MASSLNKVKSSLLLLTQTFADLKPNVKYLLEESFKHTNNNLFIYLFNANKYLNQSNHVIDKYQLKLLMNQFYTQSFKLNPNVNVTCLLHNVHANQSSHLSNLSAQLKYELVLTDELTNRADWESLSKQTWSSLVNNLPLRRIDCSLNRGHQVFDSEPMGENDLIAQHKVYANSIVGGTFDRIHIGHKIMLSECALLTTNRLLIGVTTQQLLKNKKLTELIEDFDVRCVNIKHFLRTISPDLEVFTVPLEDPFGPSITEPDYQCLIVSQETYKNGLVINEKRKENKLPELDVHVIGIVKEDELMLNSGDEDKVSSSNERRRLLGKLLKEPYKPYELGKPYVIGLTGGLASGKSSIRNDLQQLGAATIDCDKLGHKAYEGGTEAYRKIVETFGNDILDQSQNIDRKRLGQKVFGSKDELKKLTDIVWPEIRRMLHDEIQTLFAQGHQIIVVEAAVLLEAKWYEELNEIWVSFVPDEEAIRRATVRDQASLEKVKGILESQIPNRERIKHANVVFCSLWEREYTIKQVKRAWDSLLERASLKT